MVTRIAVTTGVPAAVTSVLITLPTHQAGDRIVIIMTGKDATAGLAMTANFSGWVRVGSGTGGTGTTGADTGQTFWVAFAKDVTGVESGPTITASSPAVNSWEWVAVSHRPATGKVWKDAIGASVPWITSASDVTTASPLTGTAGSWTGQPTEGDAIFAVGVVPTDLGSALGATTLTATGLTGGTVTAATTQYVENALGSDTAAVWVGWTGFTGTATAGLAASMVVTGATLQAGSIVAIALREDYTLIQRTGSLTGGGFFSALVPFGISLTGSGEFYARVPFGISLTGSGAFTATVQPQPNVYETTVLSDSPAAYYRMDDLTGSAVMVDKSGNGRNGIYENTVTKEVAGLLAEGSNPGVSFSGTGSGRASVAHASWMNAPSFTVEIIVKPATINTAQMIIGQWGTTTSQLRFRIYTLSSGRIRADFEFADLVSSSVVDSLPVVAVIGQSHHVVFKWDDLNKEASLYIDGVPEKSGTLSQSLAIPTYLLAIGSNTGTTQLWNGTLDEAAFYPTALSDERIRQHYLAFEAQAVSGYQATVQQDTPKVWWRFNERQNRLRDAISYVDNTTGDDYKGTLTSTNTPTPNYFTKNLAPLLVNEGSRALSLDPAGPTSLASVLADTTWNYALFSSELWFNATALTGDPVIFAHDNSLRWRVNIVSSTGIPQITYQTAGGTTTTSFAGADLSTGTLYHAVLTYDGTSFRLYINGAQYGSTITPGAALVTPSGSLNVASSVSGGVPFGTLAGTIDEFAYYNTVLSPIRVAKHYSVGTGIPEPTAPLVAANLSGSGVFTATASAVAGAPAVSASLTGGGNFTATPVEIEVQAASLTGAGNFTATRTEVEVQTASLTGTGNFTATSFRVFSVSASLVGSGAFVGAATETEVTAAILTGSGAFSAVAAETEIIFAGLTGSGAFTAVSMKVDIVPASLIGSGAFTASALEVQVRSAPLTGSGSFTSTIMAVFPVSAPLVGSGSFAVTTVESEIAGASLTGSGSFTAIVTLADAVNAFLAGSGSFSASSLRVVTVTAPLAGVGLFAASAMEIESVSAGLAGSGLFTAASLYTPQVTAALTGSGAFTATSQFAFVRTASLPGSGVFTSTVVEGEIVAAALTGAGAFTALAVETEKVIAALTGAGNFDALVAEIESATAALSGTGNFTASAIEGESNAVNANLSGSGEYTADSIAAYSVTSSLTGIGYFTATAQSTPTLPAGLTGAGAFTAAVVQPPSGTGSLNLADAIIHYASAVYENNYIRAALTGGEGYFTWPYPLDPATTYTFEVDYIDAAGTVACNMTIYSQVGPTQADSDVSMWHTIGVEQNSFVGSGTLTFTMGPGIAGWSAAVADAEAYFIIEFRYLKVTAVRTTPPIDGGVPYVPTDEYAEPLPYHDAADALDIDYDYGSETLTLLNGAGSAWLTWLSEDEDTVDFTVLADPAGVEFTVTLHSVNSSSPVISVTGTDSVDLTALIVPGTSYWLQISSATPALDLEVSWVLGAVIVQPAEAVDYLRVEVYQPDGLTKISELPRRQAPSGQEPLNEVGSGDLTVRLDDAIIQAYPEILEFGNIVKCFLASQCIHGFRIKTRKTTHVSDAQWSGYVKTVSGPSVMHLMDDFIVQHDLPGAPQNRSLDTRPFTWAAPPGSWYNDAKWQGSYNSSPQTDPPSDFNQAPNQRSKWENPPNFPDENAQWMWIHPEPSFNEGNFNPPPLKGLRYYRKTFTTANKMLVRLYSSADEAYTVYLDGEEVISGSGEETGYTQLETRKIILRAGQHTVGIVQKFEAQVVADGADAVIFTMMKLNTKAKPTEVVVHSDSSWLTTWRRPVPSWKRTNVLRKAVTEARARNNESANRLLFGFTEERDTHGRRWTDRWDDDVAIGTTVLELQKLLSEGNGFDVWVDPATMEICAWRRRGRDKSKSITLEPGKNLLNYEVEETEEVRNTFLIHYDGGWTTWRAKGSSRRFGRREAMVEMGRARGDDHAREILAKAARGVGWAQKRSGVSDISKRQADQPSGSLIAIQGARPFLDFGVGDIVKAPNENGVLRRHRVVMLSFTEDDNGNLTFDPELEEL